MEKDFNLRTFTAFVDNGNLDLLKEIRKGIALFENNGISVRTSRAVLNHNNIQDNEIKDISKNLKELDFWGFCVSFDDPTNEEQIRQAKNIIRETENGFANFSLTGPGRILDSNHVNPCVNLISEISKINGGIENFRLGFGFGIDSETPFFPYSRNFSREGFSIGIEYIDLIKRIILENNRKPIDEIRNEIITQLVGILDKLSIICGEIEEKYEIEFLGLDLSLAPYPYPLENQSVIEVLEILGNIGRSRGDREFRFGMSGTMFLHTYITSIIKEIVDSGKYKTTGFNGVMYSLLEDTGLSERFADGSIGISDLLLTSTTCGCGIDMVPLAHAGSKKIISSIFFDVYAISQVLQKPLGIRILPIPNSRPGDQTTFRHLFFSNTTLAEVSSGISFNQLPTQMKDNSSVTLTKRRDGDFG